MLKQPLLNLFVWTISAFVSLAQADLVVLQYHHIDDDTPPSTSTSTDLFKQQLQLIEDMGLEVVPLDEGLKQALAGELDEPVVAITFDDAYVSIYDTAWPLLRERGWPSTLFVNPGAVDERRRHYMDWNQLKDLAEAEDVIIGNHTYDHAHLVPLPDEDHGVFMERVKHTAMKGLERLQEKLGVDAPLFAYPYGEYNQPVQAWVRDQEWIAFGQHSGAIGAGSDTTALPRFPASNAYGQIDPLKTKLTSKAFPMDYSELPDPVYSENPPKLQFDLPGEWRKGALTCYGSGRGKLELKGGNDEILVQPDAAFEGRRFRYNCTYPAGDGRFYWLSQPWVNIEAPRD